MLGSRPKKLTKFSWSVECHPCKPPSAARSAGRRRRSAGRRRKEGEKRRKKVDFEFRHATSKKADRTSTKAQIDKELSKEMEIRRSSPNVVARLMGLDTLPPVFSKHQKEKGTTSQTISSVGLHDKHSASKGYKPHQTSKNMYQECKDVFEVMEMPKAEKQYNKPSWKEMTMLEQRENNLKPNIDLACAKQKFMDDEFQYCNDALENLDTNEDLIKFFQVPKVLQRNLHDLNFSPLPPHESQITILKPSKVIKPDNVLSYRTERITERPSQSLTGNIGLHSTYESNLASHSVKDRSSSIPRKSSEPIFEGKTKCHLHSSPIVILKPSLKKAWGPAVTVPLARAPENYQHALRQQERFPASRRPEVYAGGTERLNLFDSLEAMGHKTKRLREIARDVTKQLRAARSSNSSLVASSEKHGYIRHEGSSDMPRKGDFSIESSRWISNQLYDRDSVSISSCYLAESSVSREARKHLSDRWKMIKQIQDAQSVYKESGALGEVFVSDRDVSRTTPDTLIIQNVSGENAIRDEIPKRWDCPLTISSKHDWNDELCRNLPRSISLPPSLAYRNVKTTRRKMVGISNSGSPQNELNESSADSLDRNTSQRRSSIPTLNCHHHAASFYSSGEESELSEREIHVNSEELNNRNNVRGLSEETCMVPELCNDAVAGKGHEGENLASQCQHAQFRLLIDDEQVQQFTKLPMEVNAEFYSENQCCSERKNQDISVHQNQSGPESPSPASAILDQVSPVSVLELHPSEEDKPSSECFKNISADLNDLEMQLKLLRSESAGTNAEDLELTSSDEDIGEELIEAFRDDEDRDFSFLLDVLINSGVHCTSTIELFDPIGREVYEKLEKKYNTLSSWSISERLLLFDLINHNLDDIAKSNWYRPVWAREDLVEEVWQVVVKQKRELSCKLVEKLLLDPKWLDLRDDVDIVGMELERMLTDELMEEVRSQLI